MSEDIQMDVEPMAQPVAPTGVNQTSEAAITNPFLPWQGNTAGVGPGIPSQQPQENSGHVPSLQELESSMPPGVTASQQMQEGKCSRSTNDKIPAKMHIRRPGRDNWSYIGRVGIFQELTHKAPVVVVRLQSTDKVVVAFSEHSNISVDKRGNFVVIASVEPSGVVSYSLHAQTNNDALRLLASIELAAYKLGSITGTENRQQTQLRRRIEKTIKEDRRRRHRRRKDDDALVAMLGSANLGSTAVQ
ncbi:hypothetical protein CPB86DRAFT_697606 [Serendipita vermifera]|nr:hypothetical protein CPB86DRAFT_697606 [Serendipita vermifera]